MTRSIQIPVAIYDQASELAALEGSLVEEYIANALADQIAWRRYALTRSEADQERFAGVQERLPDVDLENQS